MKKDTTNRVEYAPLSTGQALPKVAGIYRLWVHGDVKDRAYIGSAVRIDSRWRVHASDLDRGVHHSQYLTRVLAKYGAENLRAEVLEECGAEVLLEREQWWLDAEQPEFNTATIAGSCLGVRHGEETRQRMSEASKQRAARPEEHARLVAISKAAWVNRTPEEKAQSVARLVRSPEAEARRKDAARAGVKAMTPEEKAARAAKISAALQARTPEQVQADMASSLAGLRAQSPEKLKENRAKRDATMAARTPEERAATVAKRKKALEARSPEEKEAAIARWRATKQARIQAAAIQTSNNPMGASGAPQPPAQGAAQ